MHETNQNYLISKWIIYFFLSRNIKGKNWIDSIIVDSHRQRNQFYVFIFMDICFEQKQMLAFKLDAFLVVDDREICFLSMNDFKLNGPMIDSWIHWFSSDWPWMQSGNHCTDEKHSNTERESHVLRRKCNFHIYLFEFNSHRSDDVSHRICLWCNAFAGWHFNCEMNISVLSM